MTPLARATAPLAPLDGRLNALQDLGNRHAGWMWWPTRAPRPHEPYAARHVVVNVVWALAADQLYERVAVRPRSASPTSPAARAFWVTFTLAVAAVFAGAWDRRAARLRRRPWHRLGT